MSEGSKETPQRPAVKKKDSKQKQRSNSDSNDATGSSKGPPKTKAKAKQFSGKGKERRQIEEEEDGRAEANAAANSLLGKKARGTEGPAVSTPTNQARPPTVTGSATSLAKPNQWRGKGKQRKQGQAVEGSSQSNAVKSSPDKKTRGGQGATSATSNKHPTTPRQVKSLNQQQRGKGNDYRRSQGATSKPRLEKAKGSLASNHKGSARKTLSQKHSPGLSCDEIRQLIKKDPLEIVERLSQSITSLQKILNLKDALDSCEDFTCDIIHVLAKACEAPSTEQLNNILAALKNSAFIREGVSRYLEGVQFSREMREKLDRRLLEDLIKLFLTYLRRLPSSFADVPIEQMKSALEQLKFEGKEDILGKLANLKEERDKAVKEHRERTKSHNRRNVSHGKPPNDFRDIPVRPSISEVTTDEKPFLRKHVTKGKFDDAEHYLDVQFRLLREDFISPLREGIAEVVKKVPRHECQQRIKLYHKVRILGKEYTKIGIVYKAQFDASPFIRTRWESSKRLIFGSFLCLSNDNFKTMLFATVANRDPKELKNGLFDIHFLEDQDVYGIQERNDVYVLAESPAYFESCRHVLSGLKEMDEENLPFIKYLVECNPDVEPPWYLRHEGEEPMRYDIGRTLQLPNRGAVAVLQPEEWPCARDVYLNESQLEAFKTALTREFSVIQGPPGTGKTFVGAKIVQCLLDNRKVWDPDRVSPMLMVCYTNHALDQFLEKVLEFLKRGIIRVGGRSKSQQLEQFNLKLFARKYRSERHCGIERQMEMSARDIKDKERELRFLERAIQSFEVLEKLMGERFSDQFFKGIQGITIAKEVFKLWICHKEAKNETVENGPAQEKSEHEGDTGDEFLSAEEDDGENREEEGEEFYDAMDYPWLVEDLSCTTGTATTATSENPSSKSTMERQCMDGNAPYHKQKIVEPMRPRHGPPDVNGPEDVVLLPRKDKLYKPTFDQMTFEETTTARYEVVQPSAQMSTDTNSYPIDIPAERHLMDKIPQEVLSYEDHANTPDMNPREHKPSISIQNHGQRLLTSSPDKDLEVSSDLAGEEAGHCQENDIEEVGLRYSLDPAMDELEGETIEIEHEATLLQDRRYLAGEEEDFVPLGAVSQEEEEEVDDLLSDDSDVVIISRSAYSYGSSSQVETRYLQGSNSSQWSSTNEEYSCRTSGWRHETDAPNVKTQEAAVDLPKEMSSVARKDNNSNFMVNYRRDDVGNETTVLSYGSNSVDDEDDHGWEKVLPKRRSKQRSLGDPNVLWHHAKRSQNETTTISGKDLRQANNRIKDERMMSEEEVREVKDIWMLSPRDRGRLYRYWLNCYRELCIVDIQREEIVYEQYCRTLEEVRGEAEEEALRRATVIGMTTSCAARYHDILRRIQPRIVVIEEAAEVLEAHIVTSLTPETQHVIMIGDHKQLRPKATVYELAQKYNLQISLFERMVLNNMDCKRLSTQHRMRPEIAQLTKRIYNHEIIDHSSVCHFDDVRGLQENMFFLDHQYPENFVPGLQSYSNKHEANFTAALCRYLLLQGYKPEQITVLTMYTGQLLELKQLMPRKQFEGVRTSVVDNFQGEENDIILLSLVRSSSNEAGRIGFLKESNRICVALSRARKGFYCIGNFMLLSTHCKLWKEICDDMHIKGKMADSLKLVCKMHGNFVEAKVSEDFRKFPNGGCGKVCDDRRDCGHVCGTLCDPRDPKHRKRGCRKPCAEKCKESHPCNKICHHPMKCGKCIYRVIKTLPDCKHQQETECGTGVSEISCQHKCEKVLACEHPCQSICGLPCEGKKCKVKVRRTLKCGHEDTLACHIDPASAKCKKPVETSLPCGHLKTVKCQNKDTPGDCVEMCGKQLSCGHKCPGACVDDCSSLKCMKWIEVDLSCGHLQNVRCADYPDNVICQAACEMPCVRGHPCKQRCHAGSECKECTKVITFEMPGCGHQTRVKCNVDTAVLVCKRVCTRKRECGHKCKDKCGNPCEAELCKVAVRRTLACNHEVVMACHVNPEEYACDVMVDKTLPCGHQTTIKCHVQLPDIVCQASVETELPCKHIKNLSCAMVSKGLQGVSCDVVVEKVLPCRHSQQVQCSADVSSESCRSACDKILDCKHPCPGRCGDDCNNFRCQRDVKKTLPCDHYARIKCCQDVRNISCQRRCERFLKCGHPCPGKCFEKCEQQLCHVKVLRRLLCQFRHQYRFPCHEDVSSLSCRAKTKKNFPCGHSKMLACSIAANAKCKLRCKKKRPCNHRCRGFCGESCSKYPCEERVNKRLQCGHIVPVRCCDSPEAAMCPAPCGVKLDCGHACTGWCFECRRRGYHEVCQLPCSRRLVCSHRCEAQCFVPCPPCKKKCERRCAHGKCRDRCSMDCKLCRMPCERQCLHYRCNNLCNESCARPACDAPCPELLPCRHPCIGLCGENCPTLCRKCHASKLSALCSENFEDKRVRFVQLIDCGHIIEVRRMDEWIQRRLDSVQAKQCPLCSTPITYSVRYGNIIRRSLGDLCRVSKEAQEAAQGVKESVQMLWRSLSSRLPFNQYRRLMQWRLEVSGSVGSDHLADLYALKNHLEIIGDISPTFTAIDATRAAYMVAKGNLSSSEQSDVQSILDGSQKTLQNIEQSLEEPEMDLGILCRLHDYVMKFALAIHLIDARCILAKTGSLFGWVTAAKLKEQTQRLVAFVRGRPDAIDLTVLFNTVNSLRQELKLPLLPLPQPIRLMNFPGFSRDSWCKCKEGHVYAIRKTVCDGRETEKRECRRCAEEYSTRRLSLNCQGWERPARHERFRRKRYMEMK